MSLANDYAESRRHDIRKTRLLMIDELSLGLAPAIVEQLLPLVRDLAARVSAVRGVNVDGVVFGVQALTPRMSPGSVFVVTASLAGLMPMESDPLYVLTKHAVVGYARSMAPVLEPRGIRINLVCPGIVRTPMTEPAQAELDATGFPLMKPEQIAEAALLAARSKETGQAWVCQPGRDPIQFKFPNVPGPRVEGAEGMVPQL